MIDLAMSQRAVGRRCGRARIKLRRSRKPAGNAAETSLGTSNLRGFLSQHGPVGEWSPGSHARLQALGSTPGLALQVVSRFKEARGIRPVRIRSESNPASPDDATRITGRSRTRSEPREPVGSGRRNAQPDHHASDGERCGRAEGLSDHLTAMRGVRFIMGHRISRSLRP